MATLYDQVFLAISHINMAVVPDVSETPLSPPSEADVLQTRYAVKCPKADDMGIRRDNGSVSTLREAPTQLDPTDRASLNHRTALANGCN